MNVIIAWLPVTRPTQTNAMGWAYAYVSGPQHFFAEPFTHTSGFTAGSRLNLNMGELKSANDK
jgi:hypothetical protein